MSSLNGRKVVVARVHTPVHFPGVGQFGPAIDAASGKMGNPVTLTKIEGGLLVECKGNQLYIPDGNVISMHLAPESK